MKNLTFQVGDIVYDNLDDKHYLILKTAMYEQEEYYNTIMLEEGTYELIGYWDYLTSDRWEKVG